MIFFPECFDHVGESKEQSIQLAESLDGPLLSRYKKLAQEKCIWLSLGGFHEKVLLFFKKIIYALLLLFSLLLKYVMLYCYKILNIFTYFS